MPFMKRRLIYYNKDEYFMQELNVNNPVIRIPNAYSPGVEVAGIEVPDTQFIRVPYSHDTYAKELDIGPEVLTDIKRNGKQRDWQGRKERTILLSESYIRLDMDNKAGRVYSCGNHLEFKEGIYTKEKLFHLGYFCRVLLCPLCAARRTEKIFGQTNKIMNHIEQHNNFKYIFLTLTIKNVKGQDLSNTITDMFDAFHRLLKRKEFVAISQGWQRSMEVTHNWVRNDYHPHIHCIIAVNPSYFKNKDYIKHEKWVNLWSECMRLDYVPWVNILAVKPRLDDTDVVEGEIKYGKVIAEITKYTAKSNDYIMPEKYGYSEKTRYKRTDEAVFYFDKGLAHRRLVAYGGMFKDIHKQLNLDDPIDGNLQDINGDEKMREDIAWVIKKYKWHYGLNNYFSYIPKNEQYK